MCSYHIPCPSACCRRIVPYTKRYCPLEKRISECSLASTWHLYSPYQLGEPCHDDRSRTDAGNLVLDWRHTLRAIFDQWPLIQFPYKVPEYLVSCERVRLYTLGEVNNFSNQHVQRIYDRYRTRHGIGNQGKFRTTNQKATRSLLLAVQRGKLKGFIVLLCCTQ